MQDGSREDIVLIIRHLVPYWAEAVDELARAWTEYGTVTALCGSVGKDDLHPWEADAIQLEVAQLRVVPPSSGAERLGTVWPRREMWEELNRLNPAVVIIHEYSPYVLFSGLIWAKAANRPCIVTSDVGPIQRQQISRLKRLVHALVNLSVEGVLARTLDALDQSRISHKTALLSPHAIDTRFYGAIERPPRVPKRIIQVGSLIQRKGVDLLLRAFQVARKTRPDLELLLVGAGDHAATLRLANEMGLEGAVYIKDFLQPQELAVEYFNSDVFVLASRFDSYGVVVHEAAAAGLPLVVSKYAGASATLVEHGVNGFRVDPHDTETFAEFLLQSADVSVHRGYSEASRRIAEEYDVQAVAHRTAVWIRQLVALYPVGDSSPRRSRVYGIWRLLVSAVKGQFSYLHDILETDPFDQGHREIVFLNRYIPFYREAIFQRVANWKSSKLLYSGKTLGNLRSADGVDQKAVNSIEVPIKGKSHIVWLGAILSLRRIRPRIVCTELSISLASTWMLFLFRPFLGYKVVFWTHGFQGYGWKNTRLDWKDWLRRLWIRWADAIIFYSRGRMEDVEAVTGNDPKYFVAPNTLDTRSYDTVFIDLAKEGRPSVRSRLGVERDVLLYVGRITAEKESLRLLDVLNETSGLPEPPELVIIGGGDQEDRLRDLCSDYKDRVRFLGPIFDTRLRCEWLFGADLVVSPGYVGLNVVDALAMGCAFATVDDQVLVKRHSPEFCYLLPGRNAIISDDFAQFYADLREWLKNRKGVSCERLAIREEFLSNCSIELQFSGMKKAFEYAMEHGHARS